jgi:hypothetical protein
MEVEDTRPSSIIVAEQEELGTSNKHTVNGGAGWEKTGATEREIATISLSCVLTKHICLLKQRPCDQNTRDE